MPTQDSAAVSAPRAIYRGLHFADDTFSYRVIAKVPRREGKETGLWFVQPSLLSAGSKMLKAIEMTEERILATIEDQRDRNQFSGSSKPESVRSSGAQTESLARIRNWKNGHERHFGKRLTGGLVALRS
jgi:hypothetical protein